MTDVLARCVFAHDLHFLTHMNTYANDTMSILDGIIYHHLSSSGVLEVVFASQGILLHDWDRVLLPVTQYT